MSEQQPQNLEPHVKEYMDSQNPTAYNTGAIESISAMPKDEKGLPIPKETAYNKSQAERDNPHLFDPLREANFQEMEQYSDAAGKYAEGAAKQQHLYAMMDAYDGRTAKEIQTTSTEIAKERAQYGLDIGKGKGFRAVEGGMLIKDPVGEKLVRSPATMAKDNQANQPKSEDIVSQDPTAEFENIARDAAKRTLYK